MTDLDSPEKKDIALQIVSTNENGVLEWRTRFDYVEDIGDGRGYTAGIVGFCSGTGDMLDLARHYQDLEPDNVLAKYLTALESVEGTDSHDGLDPTFEPDWQEAASDPVFQQAQEDKRDELYFNPALSMGKEDGLGALGQFVYYDAFVMHGSGDDSKSFEIIRRTALENAETPAQGGDEVAYLGAFLDARREVMSNDETWEKNLDRIDTEQRVWVDQENLDLDPPLSWTVNDGSYTCDSQAGCRNAEEA